MASRVGLILFRGKKSDGLLAALLVGETPTSGLNKEAFLRALDYMRRFNANRLPEPVQVAGPTLSGSISSLKQAIRAARQRAGQDIRFHIISGTATSKDNARLMKPPGVTYASTLRNDEDPQRELLKQFEQQGIRPQQVAILSEAGTAFGEGIRSLGPGVLNLIFPMELACLWKPIRTTRA